jgi:catecholate siderophore receptor
LPSLRRATRSRSVALLATSALALAAPSLAVAKDDVATDVAVMAEDAEPTVSGVVVTGRPDSYATDRTATATRTDTPLKDVPQSVTVVTEELIDDQAMQGMADVLQYVPGATMGQGEGHRDAPTLRGNASTADFFVDGVRDDVQYFRDLYNVERVEVLKGPNAMIFGRGGGGGVINRVTKRAMPDRSAEVRLEAGSWGHGRVTADVNAPLGAAAFGRVNALFQHSDSFRDHVEIERWGVNPTVTFEPNDRVSVRLNYEHFEDDRTVDRGVSSFSGRPITPSRSTFFGDPGQSYSTVDVDLLSGTVEFTVSPTLTVRNHTVIAAYDKFYQNVFPGAVNAAATQVSLAAYNNATERENLFNQTDVVLTATTGALRHTLLFGAEFGRQDTANFRNTGYFNNTATSILVPLANPTVFGAPITFRQSATDADNGTEAAVAALYVQDQLEITPQLQLIAGVRFDRFDLDFHDNRTGADLSRTDELVSPRLGVVFEPVEPLSLYASWSVSYLPASGDQFSSLSATSSTLEPEEFENLEVGAKWEVRPALMLTAALYRLDRTNTTAPNPSAPGQIVQTGAQRTTGFEVEAAGQVTHRWQILGGYAFQDAEITSTTSAAPAGRTVPLSPRHKLSLWNKVSLTPALDAGLGVVWQDEMYASISNAVVLPSFTRVDAAVFYRVNPRLRVQMNVENLLDETYFPTSHSDTNITPGAPRAFKVALTAAF